MSILSKAKADAIDPKNYPKLFIRGKSVNLWFTNIIRKNHAYNQRSKRLRDTSEGETLYFIVVYGQWLRPKPMHV